MAILLCHHYFGLLLAAQNYGNAPETATATEVSFIDRDETEMDNSKQLEEKYIIQDQKMGEGSSKKEQAAEIYR